MLSKALKLLQTTPNSILKKPTSQQQQQPSTNPDEHVDDAQFLTLMSLLNEKVHTQIQTITSQDAQSPYDISSFNLDDCIAKIDSLLWKMVVLLTRSVRDGRKANTEPFCLSHQQKLRCFYTDA